MNECKANNIIIKNEMTKFFVSLFLFLFYLLNYFNLLLLNSLLIQTISGYKYFRLFLLANVRIKYNKNNKIYVSDDDR